MLCLGYEQWQSSLYNLQSYSAEAKANFDALQIIQSYLWHI